MHSSLVQWHLTGIELEVAEDPASEEHFGISIAEGGRRRRGLSACKVRNANLDRHRAWAARLRDAARVPDRWRRRRRDVPRCRPATASTAAHSPPIAHWAPLPTPPPSACPPATACHAGMSAGVIPVVLNRGGVTDIVRHGVTGYLAQSALEIGETTKEVRGAGGLGEVRDQSGGAVGPAGAKGGAPAVRRRCQHCRPVPARLPGAVGGAAAPRPLSPPSCLLLTGVWHGRRLPGTAAFQRHLLGRTLLHKVVCQELPCAGQPRTAHQALPPPHPAHRGCGHADVARAAISYLPGSPRPKPAAAAGTAAIGAIAASVRHRQPASLLLMPLDAPTPRPCRHCVPPDLQPARQVHQGSAHY